MSYAVRNTIILLVTLTLFVGAAFIYIRFFQMPELIRLQESIEEKQRDYNTKRAISDGFSDLNETYLQALEIIENADKDLFKEPDPEDVFDYLNFISNSSTSSKIYFDYVFVDSTTQDQYGIMASTINGYGSYQNTINFINKLENSQLLNKVTRISLSPPNNRGEDYEEITFSINLDSYYERIPLREGASDSTDLTLNEEISTFNPFYPLIRTTIPPNEDNLVNIEQSRLIGITGKRVFLVDQNGNIISLRKGDKVYLGTLSSIDFSNEMATFNLNKGGITESVTLEIEQ
ncbi:MAG: hypothetical protein RI564_05060 [Gracilimonas sp.]|nr:hypothetical protein [Gracilimonas sp.]